MAALLQYILHLVVVDDGEPGTGGTILGDFDAADFDNADFDT